MSTLITPDGITLEAHLWKPPAPKGLVVIQGGTAIPQRFYRAFAEWLCAQGYAAVTYDYRGISESRTATFKELKVSLSNWAEVDTPAVHQWAQAQVPGVPLFVVGHSFGGQIVGLSPNTSVRGTLLIAAQSGYWKNWDGPKRWGMATLWHVVFPAIGGTLGYIPGWTGIGEDLPAGAASEWARWGRHPEYLFAHKTQASDGFAAYPGRIRSISIEDDAYAPRRSVEDLGRRFPVERYSHQHLVPADDGLAKIGHFGWFRKSSNLLWKQGLHWMEQCL